jgi:hypothetical protein
VCAGSSAYDLRLIERARCVGVVLTLGRVGKT